jgi:hypothetical protein
MNAPCIFCPEPRTNKLGEHIFDDWLNRLNGRVIEDRYTFTQTGEDGTIIRTFKKRQIDTASAVVCDRCNHGWMSDLTNHTKLTAEGFIRYQSPATLLPLGIATLAAFTFMKSAVIDAEYNTGFYSRPVCLRFAATHRLPLGVQIWLSWFRGRKRFSTFVWSNSLIIKSGVFNGFNIYTFTYVVGHLVFQLTYPRWTKATIIDRPSLPFITQAEIWDVTSIPIWPHVATAEWPRAKYLDSQGLKEFQCRFRNMRGPASSTM